jgi:hypothetical protein
MIRPWARFYPASKDAANLYVLFSPVFDRFLVVDNLDPWIVVETGRILSSKVLTVAYVLEQSELNNDNCLLHGTEHKRGENMYGASSVNSLKQSVSMTEFGRNNVVHKGWPSDFSDVDRRQALEKLQEYSIFVLECLHAITIATNYRNVFPESDYLNEFFEGQCPEDYKVEHNTLKEIKNILYHSQSKEQALVSIDSVWPIDTSGYREMFYTVSGFKKPKVDLTGIHNNYTLWAV